MRLGIPRRLFWRMWIELVFSSGLDEIHFCKFAFVVAVFTVCRSTFLMRVEHARVSD